MKKKIVTICLVVALAATAVLGATLAYFTDKEEAANTFTVGGVDITLYESRYQRVGLGISGTDGANKPVTVRLGENYAAAHEFTDAEIIADAAVYDKYLEEAGEGLMPGTGFMKCPYVKNTGNSPAYVRIRMEIPNEQWLDGQYTSSALIDEFTGGPNTLTTEDGVIKIAWTRVEPLAPGEMTRWNVWNWFSVNSDFNGTVTADNFTINVYADAIQAEGFADAAAAFAAFDAE